MHVRQSRGSTAARCPTISTTSRGNRQLFLLMFLRGAERRFSGGTWRLRE
jgi:hypothetical protein